MDRTTRAIRQHQRAMAFTAAGMYGAATLAGLLEAVLPLGPGFSPVPVITVGVLTALLLAIGPRLPRLVLGALGPLGVVLTAYAVISTRGYSDGAVLYVLPVLWQTLFFGRGGAAMILLLVGVADAVTLMHVPHGNAERWVDTMVALCAVALVVQWLERRNERLLSRLLGEAREDPLTGLLNRRGFDERALIESARVRRMPEPLALVVFDIDHFKHVNDEWGHDVGDRVLVTLATVLIQQSRSVDVLARFGGEEFVVLLPGADVEDGEAFAERVRAAALPADDQTPAPRLSAGVAASRSGDVDALIRDADRALYDAKRSGRDRVCRYRPVGPAPVPLAR